MKDDDFCSSEKTISCSGCDSKWRVSYDCPNILMAELLSCPLCHVEVEDE